MALSVLCPQCAKTSVLPDSAVGKRLRCKCGTEVLLDGVVGERLPDTRANLASEDGGLVEVVIARRLADPSPPATGPESAQGLGTSVVNDPGTPISKWNWVWGCVALGLALLCMFVFRNYEGPKGGNEMRSAMFWVLSTISLGIASIVFVFFSCVRKRGAINYALAIISLALVAKPLFLAWLMFQALLLLCLL
jgi:hypothetical protein